VWSTLLSDVVELVGSYLDVGHVLVFLQKRAKRMHVRKSSAEDMLIWQRLRRTTEKHGDARLPAVVLLSLCQFLHFLSLKVTAAVSDKTETAAVFETHYLVFLTS
jgi:hypothetical protein